MSIVELNWKPSDRQLRQFSSICLVALPFLGWFFGGPETSAEWQPFHTKLVGSLAALGAAIACVGWVFPQLIKPLFVGLSVVLFPVGMVACELMLLLIYGIAFVPMALVFRLIGRDALERTIDRDAKSYWQAKAQPKDASSYFRQS